MGKRVSSFTLNVLQVASGVNSIDQFFFSLFSLFFLYYFQSIFLFGRNFSKKWIKGRTKRKVKTWEVLIFHVCYSFVLDFFFVLARGGEILARSNTTHTHTHTHMHATQTINQSKSFPLLTMPHLFYMVCASMEWNSHAAPRRALAISRISASYSPKIFVVVIVVVWECTLERPNPRKREGEKEKESDRMGRF